MEARVKNALESVFAKLKALSPDEFKTGLSNYEDSDLALSLDACMKKPKNESKAKGALALAKSMTPEELKARGQKAALARWGAKPLQATHTGNFIRDFGIDVECYVLNDENKTAVISKRGMGLALGYTEGGSRLTSFIKGKTIAQYAGRELIEKLENPIIFQGVMPGTTSMARSETHGYDVTILIDLCKAIINAESDGKLSPNQTNLAKQAHIETLPWLNNH